VAHFHLFSKQATLRKSFTHVWMSTLLLHICTSSQHCYLSLQLCRNMIHRHLSPHLSSKSSVVRYGKKDGIKVKFIEEESQPAAESEKITTVSVKWSMSHSKIFEKQRPIT